MKALLELIQTKDYKSKIKLYCNICGIENFSLLLSPNTNKEV